MKEMQNGMKQYQMDKQSMVIVLMVIMVQFQEHVFNLVQLETGLQFLVLVTVFIIVFLIYEPT